MNEKLVRNISEHMLNLATKESPLSLHILNNTLCICLAAKVIASCNEESDPDFAFSRWIDVIRDKGPIDSRDILLDIIHPHVPPDLRKISDFLAENSVEPRLFSNMVTALFDLKPGKELVQSLVDHIVSYYYPQLLSEPIDTPSQVNNLCVSILNPVKGSFYDGVSGVGSTCVTVGKHSQKRGVHIEIYAQEKSFILCAVSAVRAFIHDINDYTVQNGDVLTDPRFVEWNRIKQFDYSIMFPPLGMSWVSIERELRYDLYRRFYVDAVSKANSEWLFVMHQVESLKDGCGRGIIAVSTGTLYNSANRQLRGHIIREGYIECVITLPSKILHHTTTPLSLIVINKEKRRESGILMIQAEDLFVKSNSARIIDQLSERVIDRIVSAYREKSSIPGVSGMVPFDDLIKGDCLLLPSRYMHFSDVKSEFGHLIIDFNETTGWPKIGELARIYRGLNISQSAVEKEGGEYRIINYADVKDGELDIASIKTYESRDSKPFDAYMVRPGDVLVSCKGVVIKLCIVPKGAEKVCLSLNFIGIRLKEDRCDPRYLKYYLESPIGQAYLKSRQVGTSIITLKNSDLKEMPIFLPPLEKQLRIVSEYEKSVSAINEEIEQLQRCLRDEKWRLYSHMELGDVMKIIESED